VSEDFLGLELGPDREDKIPAFLWVKLGACGVYGRPRPSIGFVRE
jgi:hypothetical protein